MIGSPSLRSPWSMPYTQQRKQNYVMKQTARNTKKTKKFAMFLQRGTVNPVFRLFDKLTKQD